MTESTQITGSSTAKHKSLPSLIFNTLDLLFWVSSGCFTLLCSLWLIYDALLITYAGGFSFKIIKHAITHELFYAIICFELAQVARVRLESRSHRMMLYHFILMGTLTFGREIFLIHNLDIWIVIGFCLMILTYVLYYGWRGKNPSTKLFKDRS